MKQSAGKYIQAFILAAISCSALAEVRMPAIFGDNMVLQQKSPVAVWGWAEPGEKVEVKGSWGWFGSTTVATKADENGCWKVKIKTPSASTKTSTLTVKGTNEIIFRDVLIGEVWVCSGQSNMEYEFRWLGDKANLENARNSLNNEIRFFEVEHKTSTVPLDDCQGNWSKCYPDNTLTFSAVAYYFGKRLNDELGVPVGLISTNWGGTIAEAWTSKETLENFKEFAPTLKIIDNPAEMEKAYREGVVQWEKTVAGYDSGEQSSWQMPGFDDSAWKTMSQPCEWGSTEFKDFDGIVWFRRTTSIPPSWAKRDLELHLGPIDDIDTVWFNGVKLGSTSEWLTQRVYTIPESAIKVGRNVIAVRIVDTGGDGGFRGSAEDMRIGPIGADVKTCATVAGDWKYMGGKAGAVPARFPVLAFNGPNHPTLLYNAMINPIVPYGIAGAIWYQGESNCSAYMLYRDLFPAMITDWREKWQLGNFPFYYVQIAPYIYDAGTRSEALRESQMLTLDRLDNVGMAVTMDIGMKNNIHPKNKVDVGDRLARWALNNHYGKKMPYSGPIYDSMAVEGNKIRISFKYAGSGLKATNGELKNFVIAGSNGKFVPAQAEIDGETVVVWSDSVKEPVAARYAWSNWVVGDLFNGDGLPASSFRTDDYPLD
jgi:sialate O-acetylesterase